MIPQTVTLYAINEEDDSTTYYLVIGWSLNDPGKPWVVKLNVPGSAQLLDTVLHPVRFVTELPA